MYNWRRHYAIKNKFEKEFKDIPKEPGIYLWTREENGLTYFYVGQAKNLFNRRFDYYKIQTGVSYPTRHFEASLKKHKDWKFQVLVVCNEGMLDFEEQRLIKEYNGKPNFVTRNDMLTGNDMVRSNFNRKEQIEKKAISDIRKCLEYVCITQTPNSLKIGLKTTKKGIPTKLSQKYFNNLLKILGKEPKNNEKIQKPIH